MPPAVFQVAIETGDRSRITHLTQLMKDSRAGKLLVDHPLDLRGIGIQHFLLGGREYRPEAYSGPNNV